MTDHRSGLGRADLVSLDERLGLLLLVRVGLVGVIVAGSAVASGLVRLSVGQVLPVCASYLAVAVAVEWYRRADRPGKLLAYQVMLPLDAVFLTMVTVPAGGPRSEMVFLFAVHLVAVTLLVSGRAGLRIALWDTCLFILVPSLQLQGPIGRLFGVGQVDVPPATQTALAIMGFWAVALCTAYFSSVNERELRRSKAELTALATMASELEELHVQEDILRTLLATLVGSFEFARGALIFPNGDTLTALGCDGPPQPAHRRLHGAGTWVRRLRAGLRSGLQVVPGVELPPTRSLPVTATRMDDAVAREAWERRDAVLARRIDPIANPVVASLLPDPDNVVVLPLQVDTTRWGLLLLEQGGGGAPARMPRRKLVMLLQFTSHASLALRSAELLAELERLASRDSLTGLANRREFDDKLAREVSRSARRREPLSLVLLDLDHFKMINDTRGHVAGDEVLRQVGKVLEAAVRDMDIAARYGGEEFALILPACTETDALRVVARVRTALRDVPALAGVTASAGVATMPANGRDVAELIDAADEALYASKRGGRNRVTTSDRQAGAPSGSAWKVG